MEMKLKEKEGTQNIMKNQTTRQLNLTNMCN